MLKDQAIFHGYHWSCFRNCLINQLFRKPFLVIYIVLFAVQLLAHLSLLSKGMEYLTTKLTIDDTYYYLQTVWNHHSVKYPTFDGINRTNGFHFLWYLILWVSAYLVPSKQSLMLLAIGVNALLLAIPYFLFYMIGRKLRSSVLAALLSLVWFAVHISPRHNLNGMESALHLFVSVWILFEIISFFEALHRGHQVNVYRLTLGLVVNAYCRVDSGLYSAILFGLCIAVLIHYCGNSSKFFRIYGRSLSVCIVFAALAAAVQFAVYYHWNGTPVPLSGIIKMSGIFPDPGDSFVSKAVKIYSLGLPRLPVPKTVLLTFFLTAAYIIMREFRSRSRSSLETARYSFFMLLIASVCYSNYLWISPARQIAYWYFSPVKVFWIFTLCLSLNFILLDARNKRRLFGFMVSIIVTVVLTGTVGLGINRYHSEVSTHANRNSLYSTRYRMSLWIRDNISEHHVLASWNAGQIGFYSDHRVINLDGLVNSKKYYESILSGEKSLLCYLRGNNVKYLVDYYDYTQDKFTKHLEVIHSIPVNGARGGGPIRVWDVETLGISDIGYYPKKKVSPDKLID